MENEREHLIDMMIIQADREEEERRIMQEINEEEYRLPARIFTITTRITKEDDDDASKINPLAFRRTD